MVDTLAPKKWYTQVELDTKLTPIDEAPRKGAIVNAAEVVKDYMLKELPLIQDERISRAQTKEKIDSTKVPVKTVASEDKAVSNADNQTTQGLVERPVEYASRGASDIEVSKPIVVGEYEREVIFPGKDGRINIIPVSALMQNPEENFVEEESEGSQILLAEIKNPNKKFSFEEFQNRPREEQKEIFKLLFKAYSIPDKKRLD